MVNNDIDMIVIEGNTYTYERVIACIKACHHIPTESPNKIITAGLLQLCDRWDSFNKDCPEWVHEALHAKGVNNV